MRADIIGQVQTVLRGVTGIAKVCGLGTTTINQGGALCRVWLQGHDRSNLETTPKHVRLIVPIQVETWLEKDDSGDLIDGPLYDLVDLIDAALHGYKMPGRGSQPFDVLDSPGLQAWDQETGKTVYILQASVQVVPSMFSLTL